MNKCFMSNKEYCRYVIRFHDNDNDTHTPSLFFNIFNEKQSIINFNSRSNFDIDFDADLYIYNQEVV